MKIMRTYITALILAATLALVSCGGGNDVASSGATAASAAASTSTTTPTEAKLNGQVDERTGVAPVVAALTVWSPTANGGCGQSSSYGYENPGPSLTPAQFNACNNAFNNVSTIQLCNALGGFPSGNNSTGSCGWLLYGGYTNSWYPAPS
jgi:hypothetical protein